MRTEIQEYRLLMSDLREDARWMLCDAMRDRLNRAADYMEKHPPPPCFDPKEAPPCHPPP